MTDRPTEPGSTQLQPNEVLHSLAIIIRKSVDDYYDLDTAFLEGEGLSVDDLASAGEEQGKQVLRKYYSQQLTPLKDPIERYRDVIGIVGDLTDIYLSHDIGVLFRARMSLAAVDNIFLRISEELGYFHVLDFTSVLTQGYDNGEYDSGSVVEGPDDSYNAFIAELCGQLSDAHITLGLPPLEGLPIWRILGESLMRFKSDVLPITGISVAFDGFCQTDEEGEDLDSETFLITIDVGGRDVSMYGAMLDCQSIARVDWPYMEAIYLQNIDEELTNSGVGLNLQQFETEVRNLYADSVLSHWTPEA